VSSRGGWNKEKISRSVTYISSEFSTDIPTLTIFYIPLPFYLSVMLIGHYDSLDAFIKSCAGGRIKIACPDIRARFRRVLQDSSPDHVVNFNSFMFQDTLGFIHG
jgi:hypothetical protein